MQQERNPIQPPKETRMFRDVSMQALADLLKTLPVPITITQHLDEQREKIFYRYQVGVTTPEHPVGLCLGGTTDFLDAVRLSLEMALNAKGTSEVPKATSNTAKEAEPLSRRTWQPREPKQADHL